MKEIMMAHKGDSLHLERESFIHVNSAAYFDKSWPMVRIFLSAGNDIKFDDEKSKISQVQKDPPILRCHSSHLKVMVFKQAKDSKWGPVWNEEEEILYFPFVDRLDDNKMVALGQAIRDIVPEFVDKEVWQTPEEQQVELNKFVSFMVEKKVCSPLDASKAAEAIRAKIGVHVAKEEERLREHLRPKTISDLPTSELNMKVIDRACQMYAAYRDSLIMFARIAPEYNIAGLEIQSQGIFQHITSKAVGLERPFSDMGIQWDSDSSDKGGSEKKITRNKMSAAQLPFDFFWSIQPSSRADGPKEFNLINPNPENSWSNLISVFGEHARVASVMVGMITYACRWTTDLRSKSMIDSSSVHIIRGVIHEAIANLPEDDPAMNHLRTTRVPNTQVLTQEDLAHSMYNWCRAVLMGYAKYQAELNVRIVGLQNRDPDGQKKRWDSSITGDIEAKVISDKLPDIEMGTVFADRMMFGPSLTRPGSKCLRIWLKPTTISYVRDEERMYSMGRYIIEMHVASKTPASQSHLHIDFVPENMFEKPQHQMMTPVPKGMDGRVATTHMHSHINAKGVCGGWSISDVVCLGDASSRYSNAAGMSSGGANALKVEIKADHVFEGAPDSITLNSVNPKDLINTIWLLLRSCYDHKSGHEGLNIDNWHCRRIK